MKMSALRSRLAPIMLVAAAISAMTSTSSCSGIGFEPGLDRPPTEYELSDVTIRLERHGCYEGCPSYTIQISGTGQIVYEGNRHVAEEGVHESRVDPDAVTDLVGDFRRADFFDRRVADSDWVMDGSRTTIGITIGGYDKAVFYFDGKPADLEDLARAIDAAANTSPLVGDYTTTPPHTDRRVAEMYAPPPLRFEDASYVGTGPGDGPRMALSGLNASGCIEFGAVDAGSKAEEDLGIHSIGGMPLHIYSVYALCPAVGIRSINAGKQDIGYAMQPLELAQGESLDLRVVVHVDGRPELSPRLCWLRLETSDPANFAENETMICVTFDPE